MRTKPWTFRRWMPALLAGVGLLAPVLPGRAVEYKFDFSATPLGEQPAGFRSGVTGEGGPGDWKVVLADFPSALGPGTNATSGNQRKVLAQTSQNEADNRFPILIRNDEEYEDFKFQARVKMVAGKVEQMAGLAFRIQDEKNYLVARVSGLGKNITVYPVQNGAISVKVTVFPLEIQPDVWHTLGVECEGEMVVCKFDGQSFSFRNSTFTKGKIGFWTKSDAVSYFADATVSFMPKERFAVRLVREMKSKYPRILGLRLSAYAGARHEAFQVVASLEPAEIGKEGDPAERNVLARGMALYGKKEAEVTVAIPVHDRNGEVVASARFLLKSFPGQTEDNAVARALPIAKAMELRLRGGENLMD